MFPISLIIFIQRVSTRTTTVGWAAANPLVNSTLAMSVCHILSLTSWCYWVRRCPGVLDRHHPEDLLYNYFSFPWREWLLMGLWFGVPPTTSSGEQLAAIHNGMNPCLSFDRERQLLLFRCCRISWSLWPADRPLSLRFAALWRSRTHAARFLPHQSQRHRCVSSALRQQQQIKTFSKRPPSFVLGDLD